MMNYIELINNFWKADIEHSFTGNETKLYMFLLHTSNSLGWKNPFRLSYRQIELGSNLTVNTIVSARNKLSQVGLISFEVGKKGNAKNINNKAIYTLRLSKFDNHTDNQKSNQMGNQTDNHVDNHTEDINKLETINNKEILPNGSTNKVAPNVATRKQSFYDSLIHFSDRYPKEMLRSFFDYWSELNPSGKKMKFEMQKTWETPKRLATWASKEPVKRTNKPNFANHDNNKTYENF